MKKALMPLSRFMFIFLFVLFMGLSLVFSFLERSAMRDMSAEFAGMQNVHTHLEVEDAQRRFTLYGNISVIFLVLLALTAILGIIFISAFYRTEQTAINNSSAQIKIEQEVDEEWQYIYNLNPSVINLWRTNGTIADCNEASYKLVGVDNKEYFLKNHHLFLPEYQPDGMLTHEKINIMIQKVFEKGSFKFEWMIQSINGEPIPIEIIGVKIQYKGETMIACYIYDLREIRSAVEREQEAIKSHHFMYDSIPLPASIWSADYKILDCNKAMVNFLQVPDKAAVLERFFEFSVDVQPCGTPAPKKGALIIDEVIKKNRIIRHNWEHLVNGEIIPVEVTVSRTILHGEYVASCFALDLRPILEMSKKESEAKKQSEILLEALPMSYFLLDENRQAVDCNQPAIEFFVKKPGVPIAYTYPTQKEIAECKKNCEDCDLRGNKKCFSRKYLIDRYRHIFPDYEQNKEKIESSMKQCCEAALTEGMRKFEYTCITLYGETIPCEVTIVPVKLQEDQWFTVFIQDLRVVKAAEKQRIEIIEESNRAKSRFLARMSHEIRTPLTTVLGIAEIELQNPDLPSRLEKALAKIHNSSELLLGIINDILDLSRIEAGKMMLLCEKYYTASMIGNIANMHLANFAAKGINFSLNIDENLPVTLAGDAVRIEQIVNNLLSNAFKYTDSGSARLFISCRKNEENVTLVIEVSDTGFGITQEHLNTMRSEYIRYHENEHPHIGGTGLGMPIVYSLLEMMNGQIDIKSEVGKGTKVTVCIPQKIIGSEILGKKAAASLGSFEIDARFMKGKFKFSPEPMPYGSVLVVDDVDANLYVARGLLNFYGLKVETCESGHSAIAKVKQGKVYDIIFMDHMMPGLNGDEAMRILRDIGYNYPIVALTANALIGQAEQFIKDGFDGFISKPIQTKHLNNILVKFIKNKQPPQTKENDDYLNDPNLSAILKQKFIETQKNTFADIKNLLAKDDIKTAHRLVHTLKSSAVYIKESALAGIAESVEITLAKHDIPSSRQMAILQEELDNVLKRI